MPEKSPSTNVISLEGVRSNNLKNINVSFPIGKITCLTGPSGSGKSSIAFQTVVAESKRRMMNCFPNDLRFFSEKPPKVDVDHLSPVLPVFGLPQINPVKGSRSNVLDSLGASHSVQALFYYLSKQYCPKHDEQLVFKKMSEQIETQAGFDEDDKVHFFIEKQVFLSVIGRNILPPRTYSDEGELRSFEVEDPYWEVARLKGRNLKKLDALIPKDSSETISDIFYLVNSDKKLHSIRITEDLQCRHCDEQGVSNVSEFLFSPFNARGACSNCRGFGANLKVDISRFLNEELSIDEGGFSFFKTERFKKYKDSYITALKKNKVPLDQPIKKLPSQFLRVSHEGLGKWPGLNEITKFLESKKYKPGIRILLRNMQSEFLCESCSGSRVTPAVKNFYIQETNIHELLNFTVSQCYEFFKNLSISKEKTAIQNLMKTMLSDFEMALNIGLGHLKLSRKTKTLSAGEYQRILLVKYLAFKGTDSLFVFDEPSVGLDHKQRKSLMTGLKSLRDQGNTVLLVEHNHDLIKSSDHEIKVGPGSGIHGGEILYEGKPKVVKDKFKLEGQKRKKSTKFIKCSSVEIYEKKYQNISIPLESFVWINGLAGTGKSSVIKEAIFNDIESKIGQKYLYRPKAIIKGLKFPTDSFVGVNVFDINLNRYTSRSTVGSFTDLFKSVRKHYTQLPQSEIWGLKESHFSPNSKDGQCLKCDGKGVELFELSYMEDISIKCDECDGRGIKFENSEITDGEQTFYEAITEPIENILCRVRLTAKYRAVYEYLIKLNLGHLNLNRKMASLSGGEKQRMQLLAKILQMKSSQVFILENVSFGLSSKELSAVMSFLRDLSHERHSIIVIDHHDAFQHFADYSIEFTQKQEVKCEFLG